MSQSGPFAPTWFFSSHEVPTQNPIDEIKKGKIGITSLRHRIVPRFHQTISKTTAGIENAVALASSAAANKTKAPTYAPQFRPKPAGASPAASPNRVNRS